VTSDPRADRHCEPASSPDAAHGLLEQFCRHPEGFVPQPLPPTRHQRLNERALRLSVGALALSVVAMTTMFIFVYSHGSGALEAAATAGNARARARVAPAEERKPLEVTPSPHPFTPRLPAGTNQALAAGTAQGALVARSTCDDRQPLFRTSATELPPGADSNLSIRVRALEAASEGRAHVAGGRESALGCE
jgi:hypothetical protein